MMGMGDHEGGDHHGDAPEWLGRLEGIMEGLESRWPNPAEAPVSEVYEFIINAMMEAGVPDDVQEKIKYGLKEGTTAMDLVMAVYKEVEQFMDHDDAHHPQRPDWADDLMDALNRIGM